MPSSAQAGPESPPGKRRFPVVVAAIVAGPGEVRITLDRFKGVPTVDVRWFEPFTPAMVPMPTRKGVTLGVERLPELARALAEAEAKASELGLLG
jgi:hypothetical protein